MNKTAHASTCCRTSAHAREQGVGSQEMPRTRSRLGEASAVQDDIALEKLSGELIHTLVMVTQFRDKFVNVSCHRKRPRCPERADVVPSCRKFCNDITTDKPGRTEHCYAHGRRPLSVWKRLMYVSAKAS